MNPIPKGYYSLFEVDEKTGQVRTIFKDRKNSIMYDWGRIACQCLALGKREYRINGIYLEYQNTSPPGSIPSFNLDAGVEYYQGLSGNRDYLRLPLSSTPLLKVETGWEDYFSGEDDDFNAATFFAQTAGTVGVNGLPFSAASNSLAIGMALVACPVWEDKTRDIVFARTYYSVSEQTPKQNNHQLSISWTLPFVLS